MWILSKLWVILQARERAKARNMNLRATKMWRILTAITLGEITQEASLGREGRDCRPESQGRPMLRIWGQREGTSQGDREGADVTWEEK